MVDQVVFQVHFDELGDSQQIANVGELVGAEVDEFETIGGDLLQEGDAAQGVLGQVKDSKVGAEIGPKQGYMVGIG